MSSFSLDLYIIAGLCVSILAGCWAAWRVCGYLRWLCEKQWDEEWQKKSEAFRIPEDCNDQPK
jgi:hypothetical protein